MSGVKFQVFGSDSSPTIYYLVGHGGRISELSMHIRMLRLFGFRVVAVEYDPEIINCGQPERLISVFQELLQAIKADLKSHRAAGLYGISLGTFLGFNILAHTSIKRGMFNTGPANLPSVVWEAPYFAEAKKKFQANGTDLPRLMAAWAELDVVTMAPQLKSKKLLCMNSTQDEIITPKQYESTIRLMRDAGVPLQTIANRRYRHRGVIIRNLLRIRTTVRFFRGQ